jgi:hypothetical protein
MQNLSRTSSGKNNKSCSIFHNESKKIEFLFFWSLYDLLRILQDSAKSGTLFKRQHTSRSLVLLIPHKYTPGSQFRPCRDLGACNVVPGRWPARLRPKSGRPAARGGRARVGEAGTSASYSKWDRGGECLSWLSGGSAPNLVVAASGGGHERSTGAGARLGAGCKGQRPLYGRHACLPATDGPTATSLGVCAGLGRNARQGKARNRPVVQGVVRDRRVRALHAACGNFKGGLGARGPDAEGGVRPRRGTRGRAGAATSQHGSVLAQPFHTRLVRARFLPKCE